MGRAAYYNEIDPFAARWLRNLIAAGHIAPGDVDTRSIADVTADDLAGYEQCHFFAGIGVWSYALRLAGWPDDRPVWTGSCPCQPFSTAGRGNGFADSRHLWPQWFRLIRERKPGVVFGEQVASRSGLAWLDLVCSDLEAAGYAVGALDLCAAGVGAPHIRQRLYFVANAEYPGRRPESDIYKCSPGRAGPGGRGAPYGMGNANSTRPEGRKAKRQRAGELPAGENGMVNYWANIEWIPCRDGMARPAQPGIQPLAPVLPAGMGRLQPGLRRLAEMDGLDNASLRRAKRNRSGRLKGYGNAIVAVQAAEFIRAYMEMECCL